MNLFVKKMLVISLCLASAISVMALERTSLQRKSLRTPAPSAQPAAQPARPARPAQPDEPASPARSARPAQPDEPAQPARPASPARPAQPDEPDQPARPAARPAAAIEIAPEQSEPVAARAAVPVVEAAPAAAPAARMFGAEPRKTEQDVPAAAQRPTTRNSTRDIAEKVGKVATEVTIFAVETGKGAIEGAKKGMREVSKDIIDDENKAKDNAKPQVPRASDNY